MTFDEFRRYCLSLPGSTEKVQWENELLFRVGGKIFAMIDLEEHGLSFKCSAEDFAELLERDGVEVAPYVGRFKWVALDGPHVLPDDEMELYLRRSYELVRAKLPRKKRESLDGRKPTPRRKPRRARA